MVTYLWSFFIFAFLGWCGEVVFAAIVEKRFVNRGFLSGPLCPIYGFGVVLIDLCLRPFGHHPAALLIGSMVVGSALEWVAGFLLEKIFHQKWWDYANEPHNLNGYICLRFSILWGLACVFVVDIIHPTVMVGIHALPHTVGVVCLVFLCGWLVVDLIATVRTITKMNRRLERIEELAARIRAASDEFGEGLANHVLDAAERGADWKETVESWRASQKAELVELKEDAVQRRDALRAELQEFHARLREQLETESFGQRRLLKAFPQLRSVDRKEALERLRRGLERRRG